MIIMKLILSYSENSYECCHKNILCVEYESAEACLCNFEEKLDEAIKNNEYSFQFCNEIFHVENFYNIPIYSDNKTFYKQLPDIYELNEWFEDRKIYEF